MYKLFHNPYGGYIYDARINKLKKISDRLYELLSKAHSKEAYVSNEEYRVLQKEGFFSDADFDIVHPYEEYYTSLLERGLNHLVMQVTQNCNLRCSYCPYTENDGSNRLHDTRNISWQNAKKAIDFLHSHSIDALHINIGFYGGEPLINFSIIRKAMEYAKRLFKGKDISFALTTNAVLLSDEILSYFNENNVYMTVSLDGPKDIHDYHRKFPHGNGSSFDYVAKALEKVSRFYPELKKRTLINMVVDPSLSLTAYNRLFEELSIVSDFGLQASLVDDYQLKTTYAMTTDFWTEFQYFKFTNMLRESGKIDMGQCTNVFMSAGLFDDAYTKDALEQLPIETRGYPAGPCIPGYTKLFVDINGDIMPCEKVSESFEGLKLGTIDTGFDLEKCKELLNVALLTSEECKKCWCFRLCGLCLNFCCDASGLSRSQRLDHCAKTKATAENYIYRYLAFNP